MQIPVVIEPVEGKGYQARTGEPLALTAEGATVDEALMRLHQLLSQRLRNGTRVLALEVPPEHPLARFAGTLKADDPMVQEWLRIMEENRRLADEDPNYL